jgi:hypothetical protein
MADDALYPFDLKKEEMISKETETEWASVGNENYITYE